MGVRGNYYLWDWDALKRKLSAETWNRQACCRFGLLCRGGWNFFFSSLSSSVRYSEINASYRHFMFHEIDFIPPELKVQHFSYLIMNSAMCAVNI